MRITYTEYKRIRRLAHQGLSLQEIALKLKKSEEFLEKVMQEEFSVLLAQSKKTGPDSHLVADADTRTNRSRVETTSKRISNRDKRIIELRREGFTLEEIAEQWEITRERVRQILVNNNASVDRKTLSQEKKEKIENEKRVFQRAIFKKISDQWDNYRNLTFKEIAKEFNISEMQLRECISKIQYVYIQANQESSQYRVWTNEQCLQSLVEAATFAFPLTALKYSKLIESGTVKGPTVALINQRFGSWVNACKLAGVEYGDALREYDRNWTDRELLRFVRWFMHQQNDGRWSIENYEIWRKKPIITGPSVPLLRLRLGTWSEIRVQALELDIAEFNMHSFAKLELNENRN